MDPHEIPDSESRAGRLPSEVLDWMKENNNKKITTVSDSKEEKGEGGN